MKKINFRFFAFLGCLLFWNLILVAQTQPSALPGVDDGTGGVEGADAPAASIDSTLFLLLLVGIVFAFIFFKKQKQYPNIETGKDSELSEETINQILK